MLWSFVQRRCRCVAQFAMTQGAVVGGYCAFVELRCCRVLHAADKLSLDEVFDGAEKLKFGVVLHAY